MNTETWSKFFDKLAEDGALRTEFVELAAKHGVDFGELSEDELEDVAGGIGTWPTPERPALRTPLQRKGIIDTNTKGIIDINT